MSNPFAVNPGGVVQGQGVGQSIGGGLAGVLMAMQQQKENQYRQMELQNAMAQQQALQHYYEQLAMAEQQRIAQQAGEDALKRAGQGEVGAAVRNYLTTPGRTSMATVPPEQQGIFSDALTGAAKAMPPIDQLQSVFGGVSDPNMQAAIDAVRKAQELQQQPKGPELPSSAQEFQFYQSLPPGPLRDAYAEWHRANRPQTTVNVAPGSSEFSKKLAEARVTDLTDTVKQGENAVRGFANLDEASRRVDKALTGLVAKPALGIARALAAMGVKPASDVVQNTQTFIKLTGEGALQYLRSRDLGSGTAVSDQDRQFVLALSGGDISLDKGTLKRIIRINMGAGVMKTQDAIDQLLTNAQNPNYKDEAPSLVKDAQRLKARLRPQWERYAELLAQEGADVSEIRSKLINYQVDDPESIIRNLPKPRAQDIGDSLFPVQR